MATFIGTNAAESIQPGFVSPTVVPSAPPPGAGADTLSGNGGNDTLNGGGGDDQLFGGLGNDLMLWNVGGGTDLFEGGGDVDTAQVNGGDLAETFTITANGTRVRFDGLAPVAFALDIGTTENLVVKMGRGSDSISTAGNLAALIKITIDGGRGNDTILGSNGADTLLGGRGADFIDGQQGNDVVLLGRGNDVFQWDPGDGSDIVEGQDGFDTLRFNGSAGAEIFTVSANGGRAAFTRNVGNIVMDLDGVERIELNALGGIDTITINDVTGTDLTQHIINLSGTLGGTAGDGAVDSVTVNAGTGNNLVSISSTAVAAAIMVTGREAVIDSVRIFGMSGNDTIVAGGFQGALNIDGGTEIDIVSYEGATTGLVLNLGNPAANTGIAAGHTYVAVEGLTGGAFDDFITGDGFANVLDGGRGTDFLQGLTGDDTYLVNRADDVVVELAGEGTDRVIASKSYTLAQDAVIEILSAAAGSANINLTGNAFGQTVAGNGGANILKGRAGDDVLFGNRGNDTVNGGAGLDIFVFNTKLKSNVDTIVGFNRADDTIYLENAIFTKLTTLGTLKKAAFYASDSGQAHDSSDRILYEKDTGKLFYDRDGTGSADAVQFAVLKGHPSIGAADFVIV